jgi:hypothetical protein
MKFKTAFVLAAVFVAGCLVGRISLPPERGAAELTSTVAGTAGAPEDQRLNPKPDPDLRAELKAAQKGSAVLKLKLAHAEEAARRGWEEMQYLNQNVVSGPSAERRLKQVRLAFQDLQGEVVAGRHEGLRLSPAYQTIGKIVADPELEPSTP